MNAAEAEPRPSRPRTVVADRTDPVPGPEALAASLTPAVPHQSGGRPGAAVPAAAEPGDDTLIMRARDGDQVAFASLYSRHASAARKAAGYLCDGPADAEDLVAESFERVLQALRRGAGPTEAFRPYLLRVLRNRAIERSRAARRLELIGEPADFDHLVAEEHADVLLQQLEESFAAKAYARLPERWQAVLWHIQVEGATPAEIAPLLGMSPNAVSALAYRAREGLREAYLQVHVLAQADPACADTHGQLGAYARGGLRGRDRRRVEEHLDTCKGCRRAVAELTDVNATLRAWIAPLVLGAFAAPHYLGHPGLFGGKVLGLASWMTSRFPQPGGGRSGGMAGAAAGTVAAASAGMSAAATATVSAAASATVGVALVAGVAGVSIGVNTVIDRTGSGSGGTQVATVVVPSADPLARRHKGAPTVVPTPSAGPSASATRTGTTAAAAGITPAQPADDPAGAVPAVTEPTIAPTGPPTAQPPDVEDSAAPPAAADPTGPPTADPADPDSSSPAPPDPSPSDSTPPGDGATTPPDAGSGSGATSDTPATTQAPDTTAVTSTITKIVKAAAGHPTSG